jgi:N-acetylglucosaminyldiphosphoundecaprenol N-acetyl-beta-D-mannosaminyltransferase
MSFETADILDVSVACLDIPGLMAQVQEWCLGRNKRTIYYVNAHCYNTALAHPGYRRLLNQADLVYADGIGVVWAGRLLTGSKLVKMTGADWLPFFCEIAQSSRLKVYLHAGKPGVAQSASRNLYNQYPGLDIVGWSDGFFFERSEAEVIKAINAAAPHVLFVGMGVNLQEKWIAAHRDQIDAPICWGVGALFDYVAGEERRVPHSMNALGFEWLWRLLMDPVGKWRRYLLGNSLFVYQVLRQRLRRKTDPDLSR